MNRDKVRRAAIAPALLVTLLAAVACGGQPTAVPPGDAAQGQSLWARSACAGCHGADAEGSAGGPALAITPLSLRDFRSIVRRGGPGMPKYPSSQASDQDLENLYAWLEAPASVPAGGQNAPTPVPANAQTVWAQSACAGCHGANAQGASGPPVAGLTQSFARFQATVRRGVEGMPATPASRISDQQLQGLYTWLKALTP